MAAKLVIFSIVISYAIFANAQDNGCSCDDKDDPENKALWKFFADLQTLDMDNVNDQAVYPGLLSPLVECNCLEKNRRKRKILPEVEDKTQTESSTDASSEALDEDEGSSIPYSYSRNCPLGYIRIAFRCVDSAQLLAAKK